VHVGTVGISRFSNSLHKYRWEVNYGSGQILGQATWELDRIQYCRLVSLTECGLWACGCHIQVLRVLYGGYLSIRPSYYQFLITNCPFFSTDQYTMSAVPSTSTSHSNFASMFNAALDKYKRNTKQDLANHPLLPRLQSCDSPDAILTVLREQTPEFSQSQNGDDPLTKWVAPTVNVLYSFSATLGGAVGVVNISIFPYHIIQSKTYFQAYPQANIIFTGIGVLLQVRVFLRFLCTTYFNTLTLRRLKMSALAETSSSTSLTASKDFSNGLRFTLALHRLRL
jgi:hypothetical protein